MRHSKTKIEFCRKYKQLALMNLAKSLFMYKKIKSSSAKVKATRPLVEAMSFPAKRERMHAHKQMLAHFCNDKIAVQKVIETSQAYKNRHGGYTRILKIGFFGNSGERSMLTLVDQ